MAAAPVREGVGQAPLGLLTELLGPAELRAAQQHTQHPASETGQLPARPALQHEPTSAAIELLGNHLRQLLARQPPPQTPPPPRQQHHQPSPHQQRDGEARARLLGAGVGAAVRLVLRLLRNSLRGGDRHTADVAAEVLESCEDMLAALPALSLEARPGALDPAMWASLWALAEFLCERAGCPPPPGPATAQQATPNSGIDDPNTVATAIRGRCAAAHLHLARATGSVALGLQSARLLVSMAPVPEPAPILAAARALNDCMPTGTDTTTHPAAAPGPTIAAGSLAEHGWRLLAAVGRQAAALLQPHTQPDPGPAAHPPRHDVCLCWDAPAEGCDSGPGRPTELSLTRPAAAACQPNPDPLTVSSLFLSRTAGLYGTTPTGELLHLPVHDLSCALESGRQPRHPSHASPPPAAIGMARVSGPLAALRVAAVCGSRDEIVALTAAGQLWVWDAPGLGRPANNRVPRALAGFGGGQACVLQVSAGPEHFAARTDTGLVYTWGDGRGGRLGHGACRRQRLPRLVDALRDQDIGLVACGATHTLAVSRCGHHVWAFGLNSAGQLGLEPGTGCELASELPTPWPTNPIPQRVVEAQCGNGFSVLLSADGSLFSFGRVPLLGTGTPPDCWRPQRVASPAPVAQVSAGPQHTVFVTVDGEVFQFGKCPGLGQPALTPVLVAGPHSGRRLLQVHAGRRHSLAWSHPPRQATPLWQPFAVDCRDETLHTSLELITRPSNAATPRLPPPATVHCLAVVQTHIALLRANGRALPRDLAAHIADATAALLRDKAADVGSAAHRLRTTCALALFPSTRRLEQQLLQLLRARPNNPRNWGGLSAVAEPLLELWRHRAASRDGHQQEQAGPEPGLLEALFDAVVAMDGVRDVADPPAARPAHRACCALLQRGLWRATRRASSAEAGGFAALTTPLEHIFAGCRRGLPVLGLNAAPTAPRALAAAALCLGALLHGCARFRLPPSWPELLSELGQAAWPGPGGTAACLAHAMGTCLGLNAAKGPPTPETESASSAPAAAPTTTAAAELVAQHLFSSGLAVSPAGCAATSYARLPEHLGALLAASPDLGLDTLAATREMAAFAGAANWVGSGGEDNGALDDATRRLLACILWHCDLHEEVGGDPAGRPPGPRPPPADLRFAWRQVYRLRARAVQGRWGHAELRAVSGRCDFLLHQVNPVAHRPLANCGVSATSTHILGHGAAPASLPNSPEQRAVGVADPRASLPVQAAAAPAGLRLSSSQSLPGTPAQAPDDATQPPARCPARGRRARKALLYTPDPVLSQPLATLKRLFLQYQLQREKHTAMQGDTVLRRTINEVVAFVAMGLGAASPSTTTPPTASLVLDVRQLLCARERAAEAGTATLELVHGALKRAAPAPPKGALLAAGARLVQSTLHHGLPAVSRPLPGCTVEAQAEAHRLQMELVASLVPWLALAAQRLELLDRADDSDVLTDADAVLTAASSALQHIGRGLDAGAVQAASVAHTGLLQPLHRISSAGDRLLACPPGCARRCTLSTGSSHGAHWACGRIDPAGSPGSFCDGITRQCCACQVLRGLGPSTATPSPAGRDCLFHNSEGQSGASCNQTAHVVGLARGLLRRLMPALRNGAAVATAWFQALNRRRVAQLCSTELAADLRLASELVSRAEGAIAARELCSFELLVHAVVAGDFALGLQACALLPAVVLADPTPRAATVALVGTLLGCIAARQLGCDAVHLAEVQALATRLGWLLLQLLTRGGWSALARAWLEGALEGVPARDSEVSPTGADDDDALHREQLVRALGAVFALGLNGTELVLAATVRSTLLGAQGTITNLEAGVGTATATVKLEASAGPSTGAARRPGTITRQLPAPDLTVVGGLPQHVTEDMATARWAGDVVSRLARLAFDHRSADRAPFPLESALRAGAFQALCVRLPPVLAVAHRGNAAPLSPVLVDAARSLLTAAARPSASLLPASYDRGFLAHTALGVLTGSPSTTPEESSTTGAAASEGSEDGDDHAEAGAGPEREDDATMAARVCMEMGFPLPVVRRAFTTLGINPATVTMGQMDTLVTHLLEQRDDADAGGAGAGEHQTAAATTAEAHNAIDTVVYCKTCFLVAEPPSPAPTCGHGKPATVPLARLYAVVDGGAGEAPGGADCSRAAAALQRSPLRIVAGQVLCAQLCGCLAREARTALLSVPQFWDVARSGELPVAELLCCLDGGAPDVDGILCACSDGDLASQLDRVTAGLQRPELGINHTVALAVLRTALRGDDRATRNRAANSLAKAVGAEQLDAELRGACAAVLALHLCGQREVRGTGSGNADTPDLRDVLARLPGLAAALLEAESTELRCGRRDAHSALLSGVLRLAAAALAPPALEGEARWQRLAKGLTVVEGVDDIGLGSSPDNAAAAESSESQAKDVPTLSPPGPQPAVPEAHQEPVVALWTAGSEEPRRLAAAAPYAKVCPLSGSTVLLFGAGCGTVAVVDLEPDPASPPAVPRALAGFEVVHVAASGEHCLAVTACSRVFSWGDNSRGQLGHGHRRPCKQPALVASLLDARPCSAACATERSVVVTADGGMLACGRSELLTAPATTFTAVGTAPFRVAAVSCGPAHALVLTACGKALSVGSGACGKLGHGAVVRLLKPRLVDALRDLTITKVLASRNGSLFLTAGGVALMCGDRSEVPGATRPWTVPRPLTGLGPVADIAVTDGRFVAVTRGGEVFAWGRKTGAAVGMEAGKLGEAAQWRGFPGGGVTAAAFSASGDLVAVRSRAARPGPATSRSAFAEVAAHWSLHVATGRRPRHGHGREGDDPRVGLRAGLRAYCRRMLPLQAPDKVLFRVWQRRLALTASTFVRPPELGTTGLSAMTLLEQLAPQVAALPDKVLRCDEQPPWKVVMHGMGADDAAGVFHDTASRMCEEAQGAPLRLFVPSPNQCMGLGRNQDRLVPNPALAARSDLFTAVGVLLGVAIRLRRPLPLTLADTFWRHLAGEPARPSDIEATDLLWRRTLDAVRDIHLSGVDAGSFPEVIPLRGHSVQTSAGDWVPLFAGGESCPVEFAGRARFVALAMEHRAHEADAIVAAVRAGLARAVPLRALALLDGPSLERLCCGEAHIDPARLKAIARYRNLAASDELVTWFWEVVEEMTVEERPLLLRFVSGRTRLSGAAEDEAQNFQIHFVEGAEDRLPTARTCFFQLTLGPYSSKEVLRARLLYAVRNCRAIDLDDYALDRQDR